MNYYIVEKIECAENSMVYTTIGYVITLEDRDYINSKNYDTLVNWLIDNEENRKNQTVTLDDCDYMPCYGSRSSTNNIDMAELMLIDDLDNPENL